MKFRCDKDHKYRFIFNYVHRTLGLSALLFSSNLFVNLNINIILN